MKKNIIDYVELWPKNPEKYIARVCRTFGYPTPVSFAPGKIEGYDNLVMDATLEDGRIYRLAHSPIQEQRGPILNRKRTAAETAYISRVRAAAGRAGAAARWAGVERRPTEKIRVYCEDADRLRRMPGTMAEAVHRILGGKKK